jgi:hypothetical protein
MFPEAAGVYLHENRRSSLGILEHHLTKKAGSVYRFYVVKNGPPQAFCIPDLHPAPVVISDSYLGVFQTLRSSFNEIYAPLLKKRMFRDAILKLIAEVSLKEGDPNFAVAVYLRSLKGKGVFTVPPPRFADFDLSPINEPMIASLFFTFVHEVGHVIYARHSKETAGWAIKVEEYFRESVKSILTSNPSCTLGQSQIISKLIAKEGSMLSPDVWSEEIWVDIFAADTLYAVAPYIMRITGAGEFDPYAMAAELLVTHEILAVIEFARIIASLSARGPIQEDELMGTWRAYSIAFQLRNEWMLERIIAANSSEKSFETGRRDEGARERIMNLRIQMQLRYSLKQENELLLPEIASSASQANAWARELDELSFDRTDLLKKSATEQFLEFANLVGATGVAISELRNKLLAV